MIVDLMTSRIQSVRITSWHDMHARFDKPVLIWADHGHSGPGFYMYEKGYPEEGSIYLGGKEIE